MTHRGTSGEFGFCTLWMVSQGSVCWFVQLPALDEIRAARALVYQYMPPTPQYTWPLLNRRLGTEVWVKHENHTPVGAFKIRGALVYLRRLLMNSRGCREWSQPHAAISDRVWPWLRGSLD